MKTKPPYLPVGVNPDTYKQTKEYCTKNNMKIVHFVSAAINYAIKKKLMIKTETITTTEK